MQGRLYFAIHRVRLQARGDAEGLAELEPAMLEALGGFPVGRVFASMVHAFQGRKAEAVPLFEGILSIVLPEALPRSLACPGDTAERDRLRASAERCTTALTDPQLGSQLDELETFFRKRK